MSENQTHAIHLESAEKFWEMIAEWVVLVDFHAERCGPCKMVWPVLEEIAEEYAWRAKVVKVDVDSLGEISEQFWVRSIPTVIVFKNWEATWDPMVGAYPKEQYGDVLNSLLEDTSE